MISSKQTNQQIEGCWMIDAESRKHGAGGTVHDTIAQGYG